MQSNDGLVDFLVAEGYLKTPRVIDAFRAIDRADFILTEYQNEAYGNYPLPIGHGQTISQPLTVAFMLELLEPRPGERILDIGAGSGWTTALLAHIVTHPSLVIPSPSSVRHPEASAEGSLRDSSVPWAPQNDNRAGAHNDKKRGLVFAIERISELCKFAKANISKYGYLENGVVELHCTDATTEIPKGQYDKIIAAASASKEIPESWRRALKVGGRIVAPVGGSIWLFTKKAEDEWEEKEFPGFTFVPLISDKRHETRNKGIIQLKRLLVACLLSLVAFVGVLAYEVYLPHPASSEEKTVVITQGLGSRKIGALLKEAGVIRSKWAFVTYVSLRGEASLLKPGTYSFQNMPMPLIVRDLVAGENAEVTLVIPEGWTNQDIAEHLEKENSMPQREFLAYLATQKAEGTAGLEGFLFPDTYRVFKHARAEDIAAKMRANFEQKLSQELRQEIQRQKKTLFEVVTMASLIEREVRSEEDRALVSGILWKRLDAEMALQVDATITYIKNQEVRSKDQGNGRISLADTRIDSPYNTYLYKGLPKGPIGNPGLSAIRAAIYPKKSPYWYYLSASDGKTIYSRSLEEHNRAKAAYLK